MGGSKRKMDESIVEEGGAEGPTTEKEEYEALVTLVSNCIKGILKNQNSLSYA